MHSAEETQLIEFHDSLSEPQARHEIRSHRKKVDRPSNVLVFLLVVTFGFIATVFNTSVVSTPPSEFVALKPPTIYTVPESDPSVMPPPVTVAQEEPTNRASRSLARKPRPTPPPAKTAPRSTTAAPVAISGSGLERVVSAALSKKGSRYVFGATGPNTFDCSGLIVWAFKKVGVNLPHYTGDLLGRGTKVSKSQLRRGDLIFPTGSHVGIYLGNGQYVVAENPSKGVIVRGITKFYTARRIAV